MKSIELTFAIHYLPFGNEVDSRDIQVSIFSESQSCAYANIS